MVKSREICTSPELSGCIGGRHNAGNHTRRRRTELNAVKGKRHPANSRFVRFPGPGCDLSRYKGAVAPWASNRATVWATDLERSRGETRWSASPRDFRFL